VHGHFIICGFGRVGEAVAEELAGHRELIVVIDPDERRQAVALQHGYRTVLGDAARDATQREAAVERAKTLIAVTESDAVNTLITLTARSLNPEIFVAAGVRDDSAEAHLKQAGANRVFSLHRIAGRRIALAALQPMLVDFVDTEPVSGREYVQLLGELIVRDEGSALAGSTIGEAFAGLEATPVLAIERVNGELIKSPDASAAIQAGDRLLLYGDESEIEEIRATPRSRRLGVSPASG
jgi:voltage-gated potassium channel